MGRTAIDEGLFNESYWMAGVHRWADNTNRKRSAMSKKRRQVIAEKIASTVRILELLDLQYEVRDNKKKDGKSPRVIQAHIDSKRGVLIYNSTGGSTWANRTDGTQFHLFTASKSCMNIYRRSWLDSV